MDVEISSRDELNGVHENSRRSCWQRALELLIRRVVFPVQRASSKPAFRRLRGGANEINKEKGESLPSDRPLRHHQNSVSKQVSKANGGLATKKTKDDR